MTSKRRRLVAALLLFSAAPLFAGCAQIAAAPASPLDGKIWDTAARAFIQPEALARHTRQAHFLLLGEIHDNPAHHAIQARLLKAILDDGRRPALVMEQFDLDQQSRIDEIAAMDAAVPARAQALTELMRDGWDRAMYVPLLALAMQYRLPVVAANLSRDVLRTVSREGYAALGEGESQRLAIETVWSAAKQEHLLREVDAGHCGRIRGRVIEAIAIAQRARDAVMADAMLRHKDAGAVAVFGRGHARRDMGVPLYLAARAPDTEILSLGLTEAGPDDAVDPQAYAAGPLGILYDYLWFTPPTRRAVDPCETILQPAPGAAS